MSSLKHANRYVAIFFGIKLDEGLQKDEKWSETLSESRVSPGANPNGTETETAVSPANMYFFIALTTNSNIPKVNNVAKAKKRSDNHSANPSANPSAMRSASGTEIQSVLI
jgi:hypothetical protein